MLKTNTNKYNAKIYKYILECIDSEDEILVTPEEKINHFFNRFEREFNYKNNISRYPNLQNRIAEYLMGLPFNFEFYNYKILQLVERLHECKLTDKQEDKILANYWSHLAYKILQLKDKIDFITFKDGFQFKEVSKEYALKNYNKQEIYGLNIFEETESLINNKQDIEDFEIYGIEAI